jgi:hypothetical protein
MLTYYFILFVVTCHIHIDQDHIHLTWKSIFGTQSVEPYGTVWYILLTNHVITFFDDGMK